jgi:hypothetical protein
LPVLLRLTVALLPLEAELPAQQRPGIVGHRSQDRLLAGIEVRLAVRHRLSQRERMRRTGTRLRTIAVRALQLMFEALCRLFALVALPLGLGGGRAARLVAGSVATIASLGSRGWIR